MIYVLYESFIGVFYFKTLCNMLMDLVLGSYCMLNLRECKYIQSGDAHTRLKHLVVCFLELKNL